MRKKIRVQTLLLAGVLSLNVMGKEGEVLFHGILQEPPPCIISNTNLIDVDFGERVGIKRVDGVNYRQPLNYQVSCEDDGSTNWVLTLSLSGVASVFDAAALQSNKDNLAIRVYINNKPFIPGSTVKIDLAHLPLLEAVPVKNAGATLIEGAFESWATLRADYE